MLPMLFNGAMPRWTESLICPPMLLPAPWPAAEPAPRVDMLVCVACTPVKVPLV